jgi:non-specific serine/threonine protein kinase
VEGASLVSELLATCRGVKIIATSRSPLHLRGEHEEPVPPLGLPAPGSGSDPDAALPEAVALFVDRARAVQGGFTLTADNRAVVNEICVRLDGLPLAIELAAARIKVLPPKALLARLEKRLELLTGGARDAPARHQTLREAIAWSYDLLTKDEKTLLRRLAVFSGGLSLDAAEEVGRLGSAGGIDVMSGVSSLVDKSLLRQVEQPDGQPRFFMLETIREFAGECLMGSGEEAEASRAHERFFLSLVEEAAPRLRGPEQGTWLERLEREHDNIRQVLARSAAAGDTHTAARVGASLLRFWLVHGHLSEGRRILDRILARGGGGPAEKLQAALLCGAGTLAHNQGDFKVARSLFEKGLALYRRQGDERGVAETLNHLAWVAWRQGDYSASRGLSEEALALCRGADHTRGVAIALNNLGWTAHYQGDYRAAQSFFAESLALQRQLEDERGVAFALNNLGRTQHELGEGEATANLTEAVTLFRKLGEKQLYAFTLSNLAHVALTHGETDRALGLLSEESIPKLREIGDRWGTAHALEILADAYGHKGDLARARAACEESRAIRRETGDAWGLASCEIKLGDMALTEGADEQAGAHYRLSLDLLDALADRAGTAKCMEGLAILAARKGDAERAARLLGAADHLRDESGEPLRGRRAARHAELRALLHEALGPDRLEDGLAAGGRLSRPEVMALASERESPLKDEKPAGS